MVILSLQCMGQAKLDTLGDTPSRLRLKTCIRVTLVPPLPQ